MIEKWDFEIVESYKTSSRHTRKRRPYRQNTHEFFRDKTAIRDMRGWVENAVNAVLERDGVTDRNGRPVRYDARSYADMGLDVVPMATISRVALEAERRVRRGEFGGDVTRILAAAELQRAAASRDPALLEVYHLETALAALTRAPDPPQELRQALPKEMQGAWNRQPGIAEVKQAVDAMLAAKRAAVADDILERSARMALDQILSATASDQEAPSRSGSGDTAPGADNASDLAALRALHAVAQEELAQLDENAIVRKRRARERVTAALQVWRDTIGAEQPDLIRPDQVVGQAAPVMAVTLPIMPEDLQRDRLPDTARDIAPEGRSRAETPRPASATPAAKAIRNSKTKKPLSEEARAKRRAVLARRQEGRGR